nr:CAP domain-containing protein [Candidatus Gracilibacteria bacterium]
MKNLIILIILVIFSFHNSFALDKYNLTINDQLLINDITNKINNITDTKGDTYTMKYIFALDSYTRKLKENTKSYAILSTIKTNVVAHIQEKNKVETDKVEPKKIIQYKSTMNFDDYKVSIEKVQKSWIGYYNDIRKSIGRELYTYDQKLNNTAQEWAETSMNRGFISHKRDPNDSYYDYNKVTSWFADRGVVCKNVNKATSTENIGKGYYKCSSNTDCTDKLIAGVKEVFDMYLSEKNQPEKAHYESIVRKEFRKIGLGISINEVKTNSYEFYITTHFCTEIEN